MSRRLSPLSVPYRTVERGSSVVLTAAFFLFSGASVFGGIGGALIAVSVLGTLVLLIAAYEVAYYHRYEYELTADTLDIRSGVVSRRNREIPLRRVQNVDISRNVVQRALGIAVVNFETAGGGETEASFRYVDFEEAKRLQRDLARLKRGEAEGTGETADELLFELSNAELALMGLFSFDARIVGGALFLLSAALSTVTSLLSTGAFPTGGAAVAVALLVVALFVLAWFGGAVVTVLNYYGFTLLRSGDELHYRRGLLRRYDGSIPLDKVQTLTVADNPLKRRFGYATLLVETAGYAAGQGPNRGSEAAVPLATRGRVTTLANAIEPFGDPEFERPPKRVRRRYTVRYLLALGAVVAALFGIDAAVSVSLPWYAPAVALPLVPVVAHYKWKHRGYWLGEDHFVARNGVLRRKATVVPYYRIQTVIDSRSLFQRRWGVGTVIADTAGSLSLIGGDAAAVDVDAARADALREELNDRLRAALAERRGTDATAGTAAIGRNDGGQTATDGRRPDDD